MAAAVLVGSLGACHLHRSGNASGPVETRPSTLATASPAAAAAGRPLTWAVAARDLRTLSRLAQRPYVAGYQRDCGAGQGCVFGPAWTDDQSSPGGHNGCSTRDDVLRQSLTAVVLRDGSRCVVEAGVLHDPYTGQQIRFERSDADAVEIDHVAALALVWDLGASRWPLTRRVAFANDPLELVATSGSANLLEKGDDGPAQWLPADRASRCDFAARFISVLVKYHLPVVADDAQALADVLNHPADCR